MMKRHYLPATWVIAALLLANHVPYASAREEHSVTTAEIVLPDHSPKRAYIKEARVELTARPLVQPLTGKLAYDETRTARVFSPISGRIISELPALGAQIANGEKLLDIDSPDLATAQADQTKAGADLSLSEKAYTRAAALYQGRAIARKDLEQAQDDVTRARSETQRTAQRLANLRVRAGQSMGRFELRAPISGIVTDRNINPGLEIQAGAGNPLLVISDTSHLWLLVDVYEKDLRFARPGLKITLETPAYPGEKFKATIDFISKIVDDASRTIKVRARVDNPDGRLMPAMYATVDVYAGDDARAILIPLTALYTEGDADWVFIRLPNGHYVRRKVSIGLHLKDHAVVEAGLSAGDTVVIDGALLLRAEEPSK